MKKNYASVLFSFFLIPCVAFGNQAADKGRLPVMDISFGGPLANTSGFVDDPNVISSLNASIQALSEIEVVREECQSLKTNSIVFLNEYINYTSERQSELIVAKENKQVLEQLIGDAQAAGTYAGEYDLDLMSASQDVARLENKELMQSESLVNALGIGSTIFSELAQKPMCDVNLLSHVVAPSINMIGGVAGAVAGTWNPLYGAATQFISSIVSYMGSANSPSRAALNELTQSSNFYTSYQCAFKSVQKLTCELEEEEENLQDVNLGEYARFILDLDDSGEFKRLRDLQRHRYRLSSLVDKLERIFNSPETLEDLENIVKYQTLVSTMALIAKQPPLKNRHYNEQMKEAFPDYKVPEGLWDGWSNQRIEWSAWWHTYFNPHAMGGHGANYLGERINAHCRKHDAWGDGNDQRCIPERYISTEKIDDFIEKVIAPALVELQLKIKEINNKITDSPNVQNLYSEIRSQETNMGDVDYAEFSLSELLDLYGRHAEDYLDSPAHFFARDIKDISSELKRLVTAIYEGGFPEGRYSTDLEGFTGTVKDVYESIASISNNRQGGGILYKAFIECKISSYFEIISESFLFHTDLEVAKSFSAFQFHAQRYNRFYSKLANPDNQGSSDLPLMKDIRKQFLNVFSSTISKKLLDEINANARGEENTRALTHMCAVFLPTAMQWELPNSKTIRYSCRAFLEQQGGISYLRQSQDKYPLRPENGPSFTEACYYKNYEEQVIVKKIETYRRRAPDVRFKKK